MSLVVFQHAADEPPSELGATLARHGHRLRVVHLYRGDPVPEDLDDVDGVISMGGPMNVEDAAEHPWIAQELAFLKQAHDARKSVVGVCLGAQLIAQALGGEVARMESPEAGWKPVKLGFPGTVDPLFAGIPWETMQFHLHGRQVTKLPPGATPLSGSKACRTQAFCVGMTTYAFQYHFEWNAEQIRHFAQDRLVTLAGERTDLIVDGIAEHYVGYRRLGDRLAERMALILFPIDKRY